MVVYLDCRRRIEQQSTTRNSLHINIYTHTLVALHLATLRNSGLRGQPASRDQVPDPRSLGGPLDSSRIWSLTMTAMLELQ